MSRICEHENLMKLLPKDLCKNDKIRSKIMSLINKRLNEMGSFKDKLAIDGVRRIAEIKWDWGQRWPLAVLICFIFSLCRSLRSAQECEQPRAFDCSTRLPASK